MKVRIVVPGGAAPGEPLSGGSLYDAELARALRTLGHDAQVGDAPENDAVNLFDGLGAPQWAPQLHAVRGIKVALIHQPANALHASGAMLNAERALLSACSAVQFVSARAERGARELHPVLPRAWVAPPGIDHFSPLPPCRERRIVANGHLWEGKGVLEALNLVSTLKGEWHLDWLGALDVDAAYSARVMKARSELGLDSRVTFHGRVSMREVADFVSRASACLCMSRYESWGLSLAESLRAGVPVVTNAPTGVLEFVQGRGSRGGDLREWLTRLLDEDAAEVREEARAAGASLPTWAECAAITVRQLEAL